MKKIKQTILDYLFGGTEDLPTIDRLDDKDAVYSDLRLEIGLEFGKALLQSRSITESRPTPTQLAKEAFEYTDAFVVEYSKKYL